MPTLPQTFTDSDEIASFMLTLSHTQLKGLPAGCPISICEARYATMLVLTLTYKGSIFNNQYTRSIVIHR